MGATLWARRLWDLARHGSGILLDRLDKPVLGQVQVAAAGLALRMERPVCSCVWVLADLESVRALTRIVDMLASVMAWLQAHAVPRAHIALASGAEAAFESWGYTRARHGHLSCPGADEKAGPMGPMPKLARESTALVWTRNEHGLAMAAAVVAGAAEEALVTLWRAAAAIGFG